jgi:hypothetical protein
MPPSPDTLRAALRAYVHTFPVRDRLDAFIRANGSGRQSDEIIKEMDAIMKTAEDHLWNYPGGVPWTEDFKADYIKLLRERHPWIDQPCIDTILSFAGWICWHEGLNARTKP